MLLLLTIRGKEAETSVPWMLGDIVICDIGLGLAGEKFRVWNY